MQNDTDNGSGFKVGDRVYFNGDFVGTVIETPAWSPRMIVVRGARGTCHISARDARLIEPTRYRKALEG